MAATTTRRSSGPVLRSLSPSGRFYSPRKPSFPSSSSSSSSAPFASSTAVAFSARSSSSSASILQRSSSPTRVTLHNPASSVRFSVDRSSSPNRSFSVVNKNNGVVHQKPRQERTCMCSPTNHPGSFRCSLHKGGSFASQTAAPYSSNSNRLNMRRSAMKNSLVRIGTVEGDFVKRALAALIRPSSHHQRRRADFQPRPSRLSVMSRD